MSVINFVHQSLALTISERGTLSGLSPVHVHVCPYYRFRLTKLLKSTQKFFTEHRHRRRHKNVPMIDVGR